MFQGRNETQVSKMIQKIHEHNENFPKAMKPGTLENYKNVRVPISIEVGFCCCSSTIINCLLS